MLRSDLQVTDPGAGHKVEANGASVRLNTKAKETWRRTHFQSSICESESQRVQSNGPEKAWTTRTREREFQAAEFRARTVGWEET